jgi:hypothetical protein
MNQPSGLIKKTLKPGEEPSVRRQQAEASAEGQAMGEKVATIPDEMSRMGTAVDLIDEMLIHPGLEPYVGPVDSKFPTIFPNARDFETKEKQLLGKLYMEGRQLLKGGGQITEQEANKAQEAFTALNNATSVDVSLSIIINNMETTLFLVLNGKKPLCLYKEQQVGVTCNECNLT